MDRSSSGAQLCPWDSSYAADVISGRKAVLVQVNYEVIYTASALCRDNGCNHSVQCTGGSKVAITAGRFRRVGGNT